MVTLWRKLNVSPPYRWEHWCLKRSRGPARGPCGRAGIWTQGLNTYAFCLFYDVKLVGRPKRIKPNHRYTLCFSRSSLATLMWPHWIASIKGVSPHLSLQLGSYWHLEPKSNTPELRKVTASNPCTVESCPPAVHNTPYKRSVKTCDSPSCPISVSDLSSSGVRRSSPANQPLLQPSSLVQLLMPAALKTSLIPHNQPITKISQFYIQNISKNCTLLSISAFTLMTKSIDNSLLNGCAHWGSCLAKPSSLPPEQASHHVNLGTATPPENLELLSSCKG